MRYLKTYESHSTPSVEYYLNQFSEKIDIKKLKEKLKPFSSKLQKIAKKYTNNNGLIDIRLIEKDIPMKEGLGENIKNILQKILNLPFYIINIIAWTFSSWEIFLRNVMVAAIVFIFTISIYQIGEHSINGIGTGVVKDWEFVPEHVERTRHTYTDSDGEEQEYYTEETIPDTWNIEVREPNTGRVETWTTIDRELGTSTEKQDVVRIEDWDWKGTLDYGSKTSGKFSGGGAGESY